MSTCKSFDDLFLDEVRDLYDAEKQLIKALPKLSKAACSDDLREAISSHLEETRTHVQRLEQVFGLLDEKPRGKHCAGIAGIIEEGAGLLDEDVDEPALDAGIIAGAQRAEHYEIGAYGSLIAWAKVLGKTDVATILAETLEEEKAADEKLTSLAEGGINEQAAAGMSEEAADDSETADDRRPAASTKSKAKSKANGKANGSSRGSANGSARREMAAAATRGRTGRTAEGGSARR